MSKEADYKGAAQTLYTDAINAFKNSDVYWQLGHVFDTLIDYALVFPDEGPKITEDVNYVYSDTYHSNACWYDDFGWWGVASLRALQHLDIFAPSPDTPPYSGILKDCWFTMDQFAPNVWQNNKGKVKPILEPRFDGGVWNADWTLPGNKWCTNMPAMPHLPSGCNDDREDANLAGIQNTVTNALYMLLAGRFYNDSPIEDPKLIAKARAVHGFFKSWEGVQDPTTCITFTPDDPKGEIVGKVFRERAPTYAKYSGFGPSECYPRVVGYNPLHAWTGDQGLIIQGLIELAKTSSETEASEMRAQVRDILNCVVTSAKVYNDSILQAWVAVQSTMDPTDYSTGIGVFMRGLLRVYQTDATTQAFINSPEGSEVRHCLQINADAAVIRVDKGAKDYTLIQFGNDLATLLAGYHILG